jgi:hypothetical protein
MAYLILYEYTSLFRLINAQKGALHAPPQSSQILCFPLQRKSAKIPVQEKFLESVTASHIDLLLVALYIEMFFKLV